MDKKLVKKHMQRYKLYSDWIEIYNDQLTSGMGMSYEGVGGKSEGFKSDVENKVIKRDEKYKEYKDKKQYIELIDKVLDKLTDHERIIIEMKYNIDDIDYLKQHQHVPDWEIYNSERFHYERRNYYNIKQKAYNKLNTLLRSIDYEN